MVKQEIEEAYKMDYERRRLFGERLKALREAKGMSQEQLGKMIGKSRQTIIRWEAGDQVMKDDEVFEIIDELSEIFEAPIPFIAGTSDEYERKIRHPLNDKETADTIEAFDMIGVR